MEKHEQFIQNPRKEILKTQIEHKSCQDKINFLEAQLSNNEEEVERLRSQIAVAGKRELNSQTKVTNLKKALETSE